MMRITLVFLFLVSLPSFAATSNGSWLGTFTKKKINSQSFYWAETQLRYDLSSGEMGQLLYRFGYLRLLNTLPGEGGALYGYIQTGSTKEHRLTAQYASKLPQLGENHFSTRIRLEHRILEDNQKQSQRFRVLVRGDRSLDKDNKIVIWDEVFININDNTWAGKTLDRNRLFIGARRTFKNYNIEFGYLNQYVTNRDDKQTQHILVGYFNF